MSDPFLEATAVTDENSAMREALKSTLQQRRNKVYSREEVNNERGRFREDLRLLMRTAAKKYHQPVSDAEHCAGIRGISATLSTRFTAILNGGRFRYGTAQKALNLYLKFLWRLGRIPPPPHCPVDGIVMAAAGIEGRWTHSDSEAEYARWISTIRLKAKPLSIAEWEYRCWSPQGKASQGRGASCC